jgi:site-specific recombinase XerD
MSEKPITLSQALEGYFLAAYARRLSQHTIADYSRAFSKLEHFLATDPPLASITASDIRAFQNSLSHLSDKSVLNHHIALSALWTWAQQEQLVADNIVRQVKAPKPEKRANVPYTEQDVKAMLAACDRTQAYARPGKRRSDHRLPTAKRDRAILTLLVDTGLRASELCDLRIIDADLRNENVHVMGKGDKERTVPFCSRTAQVLWRYLVTRDDRSPSHNLFTTRGGGRMDRHNLRHMVQGAARRAGVQRANVHRFRHTFAINFLRNGGNVFALKEALGHESMNTVLRYLDVAQADVKEAHRIASPVANWVL